MTTELIAILTIGVTLASRQLATVLWITGRFERMEKNIAERFERAEQRTTERFERAEQRTAERFERAEQRSTERFEQLLRSAAEQQARMARIEGLLDGSGAQRPAAGTSRDARHKVGA